MIKTIGLKVDYFRNELYREIENCTSLTDSRVVVLSQLLDEFVVEYQRQLISRRFRKKKILQM